MDIMDRKLKILNAIINDFIDTAQPIGSRTIAKKYDLGISSATIRNEMADLEEMGYLLQPYTSAGRIPSDLGYRVYINKLMKLYQLKEEQKKAIRDILISRIMEIDELMQQASSLLSQLTNLTSVGLSPQFRKSKIKNVKLLEIDDERILLILVSNTGVVKNIILKLSIKQDILDQISNLLQYKLQGLTVEDIDLDLVNEIRNELFQYNSVIEMLIPILKSTFSDIDSADLFYDGLTNIFNLPEFSDMNRAKRFLSTIENKELILKLFDGDEDLTVKIGRENNCEEMNDCSVISATYKLNGKIIGRIGVIGPTRMDYSKNIPIIKYITDTISEIISNRY